MKQHVAGRGSSDKRVERKISYRGWNKMILVYKININKENVILMYRVRDIKKVKHNEENQYRGRL